MTCRTNSVFFAVFRKTTRAFFAANPQKNILAKKRFQCWKKIFHGAWTHLKSWRDKRRNKSRKQASIPVRSWWALHELPRLLWLLHKNYFHKIFFFLLVILWPHYLVYFLKSLSFSFHNRVHLTMTMMILPRSFTNENQNFPIDKHLQQFSQKNKLFSPAFSLNFPIFR